MIKLADLSKFEKQLLHDGNIIEDWEVIKEEGQILVDDESNIVATITESIGVFNFDHISI